VCAMAMIFRGEEGAEEVPMVSRGTKKDTSVVFLAKSRYVLVDQNEFQGPMTVFGKVQRLVPEGQSLDLFDFLKLPSAIRGEANPKRGMRAAVKIVSVGRGRGRISVTRMYG
jgi:hypothetical protein